VVKTVSGSELIIVFIQALLSKKKVIFIFCAVDGLLQCGKCNAQTTAYENVKK